MSKIDQPSRYEVIEQLAAELNGPILLKEFIQQVLSIWHSTAKKPESGVRQAIRDDYEGDLFLFLDAQTIVPSRLVLNGIRLRVPLSAFELEMGCLIFVPAFSHIVKSARLYQVPEEEDLTFEGSNGRFFPTKFVMFEREEETHFGRQTIKRMAVDLSDWLPMREAAVGDSIILTILDWENGRFQFELEPASQRQAQVDAISKRNQMLADYLYADLESANHERIWAQRAIRTALVRLPQDEIIPDHWLWVIKEDRRMDWTMNEIGYRSDFNAIDMFFEDFDVPDEDEEIELSDLAQQQVYRFKVYFKQNKKLWRRIEIQGEQTLDDLDEMLHAAFKHDWDHLSGFWRLIPRGKGKRFREEELAVIYPFGNDGYGGETQIAALELKVGDALKYVYDFGDWVEHRLELEAVEAPVPEAEYPRQIAENKPQYRYCPHCKEQGKKEIATWICIECSDAEEKEVLVCEACLQEFHPEHYADEILY